MRHARSDYDRIQDPSNKIPQDEPVFLLRGQDKLAEEVIAFYIEKAKANGLSLDFIRLCEEQLVRIKNWATKKLPDVPVTGTQSPA